MRCHRSLSRAAATARCPAKSSWSHPKRVLHGQLGREPCRVDAASESVLPPIADVLLHSSETTRCAISRHIFEANHVISRATRFKRMTKIFHRASRGSDTCRESHWADTFPAVGSASSAPFWTRDLSSTGTHHAMDRGSNSQNA
jgi:hypothetical protein